MYYGGGLMDNNTEFLDSVVCKLGSRIAEKISKSNRSQIDKSLGVLSNDGVYAYYVYIISKKIEDVFLKGIKELMNYTDTKLVNDDYEGYFVSLSSNVNDLLFFKELLEKTLIYARYHAKAREQDE